ncbi:MAG TPA: thiamine phosphate synthase [Stellaceae bacterium]|nr:thiamine phosphate synthase [Stellaceae bacterium]
MSRLYLITPPALEPKSFATKLAGALDAGDIACVQLRLKNADDDSIRRAADILRPIVQKHDAAFLMNDRADLALACGCDGVHVGPEDTPYAEARALLGPERIVGVTCRDSRHDAIEAAEAGADYVAFGAFFPTQTKEATVKADPEILRWWSEIMTVPCVAIGGITPQNCAPLVQAGADFLAVIAAVWDHPQGPGVAVKEFALAIAAAQL